MPKEDEQNKERSKISMRIGEVQVELEGTYDNIKKLMDKDLVDFAKGLEDSTKQLPPSTAPKVIPRAPETPPKTLEVAPKEKAVPPPPPSTKPSTAGSPLQKSRLFAIGKKTEEKGNKKIGWKKLAIALGVVCMLLAASVVGVIAVYLPTVNSLESLESQIAEKDINIAALNSTVFLLRDEITSLQESLNQKNSTITSMQATVDWLNEVVGIYRNIITMNASEDLFTAQDYIQNQNESTVIFQDTLEYAGYVGIAAQSSSNTTYVQLRYVYASGLINYDQNVTLAESGSAYFPVLPGIVEITVGNTDTDTGDTVTGTTSAIYYY